MKSKRREIPFDAEKLISAVEDVRTALSLLNGDHIEKNLWRLGLLGSQDINSVRQYLLNAELKLIPKSKT